MFTPFSFRHFEYLPTVGSTNDYLRARVPHGIPRLVVADEQTGGKGRFGRRWHSEAGQGLYVSYLLYPNWSVGRAPFLNRAAGLSVLKAIRRHGGEVPPLGLKEPNDVLIGGLKVCGILTELSSLQQRIEWAIIGIGVNVYQRSFPEQLAGKATSLALEGIHIPHPLDLCDDVTRGLETYQQRLDAGEWEAVEEEFGKNVAA